MHSLITAAILGLGGICFAAFSWGVKGHFRATGAMPAGMKVTGALSLAGFIWFLARLASGVGAAWPASLALFALALGLFAWAVWATAKTPPSLAFATDTPKFLLRDGPYRFVRHPFYLAYLLFWAGTAAIGHGVLAWAAPAIMAALYCHAARREERKFANSELAADYAAYRARAGMFLPRRAAWLRA